MRFLAALGLLVAGAATGLASVALHEIWWGFVLALCATASALVAVPAGWWSRLAFVVGWDGLVGWLTAPRPEGDYVISQDWQGYGLLGAGLLLLVAGVATLPGPRRRPGAPDRRA